MAKEVAIKKIAEQLSCSICLDTYSNPKLLQCFHVNCRQCLVRLLEQDRQGTGSITCPTCRQTTPLLASGGVDGLPSAFHITQLLEIQETVKKIKGSSESEVISVDRAIPHAAKVSDFCLEHSDQELALYCRTCKTLICFKCALKGGKHHTHSYKSVEEAFEKYANDISASLKPVEKQLDVVENALVDLDASRDEITAQQKDIEAYITSQVNTLLAVLTVRKTELINKLHEITQAKLKKLAAQRDLIETAQARLTSCMEFMKESLKAVNQGEALKSKSHLTQQVKELTIPFHPASLEPCMKADVVFLPSENASSLCHNFGKISALSIADPEKSTAKGEGLELAIVGERANVDFYAVNFSGTPCMEAVDSIECEIVSKLSGMRVEGMFEKQAENLYSIFYMPVIKGRHQLHIRVEGRPISGSPFSLSVRSSTEELNTPLQVIHKVEEPWGVALTPRGNVIVTEKGRHTVSIFGPGGDKIGHFGSHGLELGQFNYPRGVAVDAEGNIYIADRNNNRIQKFTETGTFLAVVSGEFHYPSDVTINPKNQKIYISDTWNERIQVLNPDLTLSLTFGRKGSGMRQFASPIGITCDMSGRVYVADSDNHRIQVFTPEGKFIQAFMRRGSEEDIYHPIGITIDNSGFVYVSELENHRISVFTTEGRFVRSFGCFGDGPGEFQYPRGVAVDGSGVVYVCDQKANRVQVF